MPAIEQLGFSRTHRREIVMEETMEILTSQIVNTGQEIHDNGLSDPMIESLSVAKLVAGTITSQTISLAILDGAGDVYIKAGTVDTVAWTSTGGFILGLDDSASNVAKLFIGDATTSLDWNVTTPNTLTLKGAITATTGTIGGFSIGADYIRDTANSFGLASTVTGGNDVRFWAGATFANRATASSRIHEDGTAVFSSVTANGSTLVFQDVFGDGSDGAATISGNTTLTSDMYYTDLTINTGVTLNPGGFRIFVKGTLTINGTGKIARNGNNGGNGTAGSNGSGSSGGDGGAGGTAGAALADGSIKGSVAGAAGGTGGTGGDSAGTPGPNGAAAGNGTAVAKSLSGAANNGGAAVLGGASVNSGNPGGTGGARGTAGASTGTVYNEPRTSVAAYLLYDSLPSGDTLKASPSDGGAGGGGGGGTGGVVSAKRGGGGGGGGGSASPGAIVVIFAKTIVNSGTISANGGNGGNGANGGNGSTPSAGPADSGGGGGGSAGNGAPGGVVILVYSSLTNTGTIQAAAGTVGTVGTGGTGAGNGSSFNNGATGTAGTAGNAGAVIQLQV